MENEEWLNKVLGVKDQLFRLALRLLNNRQEAEDAVQETIIRIWKKKQIGDLMNNPEAMAMTIVKNFCLDQLRSKRWNEKSIDNQLIKADDSASIVSSVLEFKEAEMAIEKALMQLPEQQKIIFHLREAENLDFDEIAEITGLNVNTIRVNLSRARKQLRLKLYNIYDHAK